jgi:hypothetical protein
MALSAKFRNGMGWEFYNVAAVAHTRNGIAGEE